MRDFKKAKPVSADTRFPSVSRKIRGIITITDPAIIEGLFSRFRIFNHIKNFTLIRSQKKNLIAVYCG
jgi:hypothetical protein